MTMKQKGFTLTETLIIGAIIALLAAIGVGLLSIERARIRDAKRITDMTHFAAAFAILYAQKASYASAAVGCPQRGSLADTCTLPTVTGFANNLKDPSKYSYRVTRVPDAEDFGISFRLERSYGTLTAGPHTLSKQGLR